MIYCLPPIFFCSLPTLWPSPRDKPGIYSCSGSVREIKFSCFLLTMYFLQLIKTYPCLPNQAKFHASCRKLSLISLVHHVLAHSTNVYFPVFKIVFSQIPSKGKVQVRQALWGIQWTVKVHWWPISEEIWLTHISRFTEVYEHGKRQSNRGKSIISLATHICHPLSYSWSQPNLSSKTVF